VGMNRQSGSAEDVMLRNLVNGDVPRRCSGRPERPVEGRRARRPRSRKSFVIFVTSWPSFRGSSANTGRSSTT
jgi:hypothetical protein